MVCRRRCLVVVRCRGYSFSDHELTFPLTYFPVIFLDETIYDTVFQTTNGYALILRVTLPHDVHQPPTMALHGVNARHNWIDAKMKVVGYSPISSGFQWKQSKMKLGDAVYAVILHFQVNPRELVEWTCRDCEAGYINSMYISNSATPLSHRSKHIPLKRQSLK